MQWNSAATAVGVLLLGPELASLALTFRCSRRTQQTAAGTTYLTSRNLRGHQP